MLVTDNEEVAITALAKNYLPLLDGKIRLGTARNMVRTAAYSETSRNVPVVTEGIDSKVQVTYDGLQWTIREITS